MSTSKKQLVLVVLFIIIGAGVSQWSHANAAETTIARSEDALEGFDEFLYAPIIMQGPCSYREQERMIIIEVESGQFNHPDWSFEQSKPGYFGSGYMTWRGANLYGTPGVAPVVYRMWVDDPDDYLLRIHNWHNGNPADLENDVWVRMDGGPWVKNFSWNVGEWDWYSRFDLGGHNFAEAMYTLDAGYHEFEMSPRSYGFRMDRISIHPWGTPGEHPGLPESPCR